MNSEVLLSVIVPAYNVAEWLPRCLDSILSQTYSNIEVVVIDDGSTDDTSQIIDDYAVRDLRIRAFHQQNKGLVETRERGIKEAKGTYIGFVDGDDEITPEMYEKLIKNALLYNAQISQCGILYCFYDGRRKPVQGTGKLTVFDRVDGCKALLLGTEMEPSLCNKIYLSTLLKESCLNLSVVNNEDMLRNIVLFNRAQCSVMEDFCGYLYWRRNESMSNNRRSVEIGNNILIARKQIMEYVPTELKAEAHINYLLGAINVYNSLIGHRSNETDTLRKECRCILKNSRNSDLKLSQNMHIRILLILYFPHVYKILRHIHVRRRKKRIVRQAVQARQMSLSGEG